jgi:hypothetical protein
MGDDKCRHGRQVKIATFVVIQARRVDFASI